MTNKRQAALDAVGRIIRRLGVEGELMESDDLSVIRAALTEESAAPLDAEAQEAIVRDRRESDPFEAEVQAAINMVREHHLFETARTLECRIAKLNEWWNDAKMQVAAERLAHEQTRKERDALYECEIACEEFIRKVDAGKARSKRSYTQMVAALQDVRKAREGE